MPIYRDRNSERKFSMSPASSVDKLGKIIKSKKRIRQKRNNKKTWPQRNRGSSEWMFISQDGDKMSFKANSHLTKNFEKIQTIGKGGFGTVVKVKKLNNKIDTCFYAIKCILLNLMNDENKKIIKEAKLLRPLTHDNIVRYFSAWIDDCTVDEARTDDEGTGGVDDTDNDIGLNSGHSSSAGIVFQDGSNTPANALPKTGPKKVLCIQMEFCKTTLADAINTNYLYKKHFRAWRIFWEMVKGLAYLKKKCVIHRDLKPQNVFLDAEDRVKIGDFGLATKMFRGSNVHGRILGSLSAEVGTSLYRAPELDCSGSRAKYGQEIDIYSLGIILFEMFHPPFTTGSERRHVLNNLRKKEIVIPEEFLGDEKNAESIVLLRLLLDHDASSRPTCPDLIDFLKSKNLTYYKKPIQKQLKWRNNFNPQQPTYDFTDVYERLGNAKIYLDNFKMIKFRGNTTKNVDLNRYINNKDEHLLNREEIIAPWRGYFTKTSKKVQQQSLSKGVVAGPIEVVTLEEVKRTFLKTIWIPETRRFFKTVKKLATAFNKIIKNGEIPDLWRNYEKNNSDDADYDAIYLTHKIWENIIADRLRRLITMNSCCTNNVKTDFTNSMKCVMEKYRSLKKDIHLIFIHLEKDQVPQELVWTALRAQLVPEHYIDLIKGLCHNINARGRGPLGLKLGVPQGSALSLLLFNTVVNYVTENLQRPKIWTLMFANNIVLVSETVKELQNEMFIWCHKLESKGLRVNRSKTDYLRCNFSEVDANNSPTENDIEMIIKLLLK